MSNESSPKDPERSTHEITLPTFEECNRGMEVITGWVPFYDEAAGRRIAWAVLFGAKNPGLTREDMFKVMDGVNGDLVEPPLAPEVT